MQDLPTEKVVIDEDISVKGDQMDDNNYVDDTDASPLPQVKHKSSINTRPIQNC